MDRQAALDALSYLYGWFRGVPLSESDRKTFETQTDEIYRALDAEKPQGTRARPESAREATIRRNSY